MYFNGGEGLYIAQDCSGTMARYSIYLLYKHKSSNTDAEGAASMQVRDKVEANMLTCADVCCSMEVRDNVEANILSHASARNFVSM